jgi:hypothetical protein
VTEYRWCSECYKSYEEVGAGCLHCGSQRWKPIPPAPFGETEWRLFCSSTAPELYYWALPVLHDYMAICRVDGKRMRGEESLLLMPIEKFYAYWVPVEKEGEP